MADFDLNQKPLDEESFKKWFSAKFNFDENRYSTYYDNTVSRLQSSFVKSIFWKTIKDRLKDWDSEYYLINKTNLFNQSTAPDVVTKTLDSLLNKAYRKNILKNNKFPNEPEESGWISQNNWFVCIHDIVRTMFVVKYLDGVKFLNEKMSMLADELNLRYNCSYEAHDDGYYAAHAAIVVDLPLIDYYWNETKQPIEIEIQITTELQEMIKQLLHKFYEENRKIDIPKDYKWQWDYNSEQFTPNYMGHIAHYIEGMIVEIRNNQNKK